MVRALSLTLRTFPKIAGEHFYIAVAKTRMKLAILVPVVLKAHFFLIPVRCGLLRILMKMNSDSD